MNTTTLLCSLITSHATASNGKQRELQQRQQQHKRTLTMVVCMFAREHCASSDTAPTDGITRTFLHASTSERRCSPSPASFPMPTSTPARDTRSIRIVVTVCTDVAVVCLCICTAVAVVCVCIYALVVRPQAGTRYCRANAGSGVIH